MKERPLLFTPENAQKCHVGTKTQTRRIVKDEVYDDWTLGMYHPLRVNHRGEDYPAEETFGLWGDGWDIPCPYGVPGDRLWVREASWIWGTWVHEEDGWHFHEHYSRQVTFDGVDVSLVGRRGDTEPRWIRRPGMFMPRWACRTVLEITEIRVQRVQEISYEDEGAEGVMLGPDCNDRHSGFIALWDSINGPGNWDVNPWVWAISFRKVQL